MNVYVIQHVCTFDGPPEMVGVVTDPSNVVPTITRHIRNTWSSFVLQPDNDVQVFPQESDPQTYTDVTTYSVTIDGVLDGNEYLVTDLKILDLRYIPQSGMPHLPKEFTGLFRALT